MNNEEKIKELVRDYVPTLENFDSSQVLREALTEIAEWKDEQFDKKLQEIVDYIYPLICGGERLHINEIIGKDMVWKH